MVSNAQKFLKDNNIEFTDMGNYLSTYTELPFTDKDMRALSKFWNINILKNDSGNWVLDGLEIKVF